MFKELREMFVNNLDFTMYQIRLIGNLQIIAH